MHRQTAALVRASLVLLLPLTAAAAPATSTPAAKAPLAVAPAKPAGATAERGLNGVELSVPVTPIAPNATKPPADLLLEPTAVSQNLLANPGFENARDGWGIMNGSINWSDFEIAERPVHWGHKAAYLAVHSHGLPEGRGVKVFGVVQEVKATPFPDTISGWYRVESYDRGKPEASLYLQAVVIIWGDPRTPDILRAKDAPPNAPRSTVKNYQVRYYLSGIEKPPFVLANAHYQFVGHGDPQLHQWVHFEMPVKEDFQRLWGVVPEGYEFIRVLFEGRWDNKPASVDVAEDVYYDDLFLGYGKPPEGPPPAGHGPSSKPASAEPKPGHAVPHSAPSKPASGGKG